MKTLILFLSLVLSSAGALAESKSMAMPGDNRLVVFNFDNNNTYTILTIPSAVTDIQLMPDEKISAMAVGDTVQWVIAKTDGHVFVKPSKPDIFTSATIVTDKRSYQLTLRASPVGGKWYQRVSWSYPDVLLYQQQLAQEKDKAATEASRIREEEKKKFTSMVVNNDQPGIHVENLNHEYEITGSAPFKPKLVFDDGRFTRILMPNYQEWPALFLRGDDGKYELITYIRDKEYIKVPRLFGVAVLKLGKNEVTITNKTATPVAYRNTENYFNNIFPGH